MISKLYWGKRPFFNTYQICSAYYPIGKLFNKTFSQSAVGELNGKSYSFKTGGFLKTRTEITDNLTNELIGDITYSSGMTKATLSIHGKKLSWKNNNFRSTKWQISDNEGVLVKYNGTSTGGQIDSNTDDDLYVLTGLYITSHYWQMVILVMFLALISIWVALFNK